MNFRKLNKLEIILIFILLFGMGFGLLNLLFQSDSEIKSQKVEQLDPETKNKKVEELATNFIKNITNGKEKKSKKKICYSPSQLENKVKLAQAENKKIEEITAFSSDLLAVIRQGSESKINDYKKRVNIRSINPPSNFLVNLKKYIKKEELEEYINVNFNKKKKNEIKEKEKKFSKASVYSIVYTIETYSSDAGFSKENIELIIWNLDKKKKYDQLYQGIINKFSKATKFSTSLEKAIIFESLNLFLFQYNTYYFPRQIEYQEKNQFCISGIIIN